jgi:hypothetical protein
MLACIALPLTLPANNLQPNLSVDTERPQYIAHAEVDRFEAVTDKAGNVFVTWHTTLELGVGGFRVLRKNADNTAQQVGSGWVPAQGNEEGGFYKLADFTANLKEPLKYELWTMANGLAGQMVACWQGTPTALLSPTSTLQQLATTTPASAPLTGPTWIGTGDRVRPWTNSVPADRVRLSLREEGIYRVTTLELAVAMGVSEPLLAIAVTNTNLSISCQGQPVAWLGEGTNIFFYGLPAVSRFAPENVYWVSIGLGDAMLKETRALHDPPTTNAFFNDSIERVGTTYLARVSYSSLADAPAPYIGFPLMNGLDSFQNNEILVDPAPSPWTGSITVNLLSYYEDGTDNHSARVSVGGVVVGQTNWSGEKCVSVTYPFSATNLAGSVAVLRIDNTRTANIVGSFDNTRFYCFSYHISYQRLYRAKNNMLRCTGGENNTIAVTGFATNDTLALDVTDPAQPVLTAPLTVSFNAAESNWTAALSCGGTDRVYAVCSRDSGIKLPAVRGVHDVDWAEVSNSMDYAILIPPEAWRSGFREAVQPLADYRASQGLHTQIVDVESIYNRFSYGLVDPDAIRAFCRAGRAWSSRPLNYMLLVGAGALDFKHQRLGVNDYTACLIPTVILGQRFFGGSEGMTVSADQAFGDIDGDHIPEVAIGRLPTTKTQDVSLVVQKTITYEETLAWKMQFSLAADWTNSYPKYYNFTNATDRLITPLTTKNKLLVTHYPEADNTTGNLALIRTRSLFPALFKGSRAFHFFGHTTEQDLGGGVSGKLLSNNSVNGITISSNFWQKPTIAVIMGCRANRWQSLTTTVCILPYGLFAANTGFVAGLGATGYMLASEEESFSVKLYTEDVGATGTLRLGDLLRRGLQRMAGSVPPERILCFSLIGDPALVFYYTPPQTSILMIR